MTRIAIVGMACQYPDAVSPDQLWENVVSGRRAFRRLPDERMRLDDYWAPEATAPDRFYARNAAVIEGYRFDRVGYRIAGSTYRSTDLTHWLALDTAAQALADAGFPEAEGLSRERTAVVVGNSLTGEFSRANQLRLRWPYVRRTIAAALKEEGWDDETLSQFLARFEQRYKSPFPAIDEDTLAGSLSNTIAGRICNHFDLKGGGYTVDGACSSSLLSVATACRSLMDGEVDVAIAGGVDLSIDPFEIVGFAKTGALATSEMRVYDRGSNGFWPGEGCGMVVLMRESEAESDGRRTYATVAGWGISSDGKGGITRPEVDGYQLALRRAYERTGFGIETVGLFEGHGTGTPVGDATELKALSQARRTADPDGAPAAISTIKAMIGHTKAAAGVAGLIKAALAVHHEVLPPTVGCVEPHPELDGSNGHRPALRVLPAAEVWPAATPVRAGITAMGFGGINTHVVLENRRPRRRRSLDAHLQAVARSRADAELLLLSEASPRELRDTADRLARFATRLSYAEVGDLGVALQRQLSDQPYRAALVVVSPEDAVRKLERVRELVDGGSQQLLDVDDGLFLGEANRAARIGYLFPGQGSGKGISGGALRRRFAEADEIYTRAALPTGADTVATAVAQPRIVTGSLAALRVLSSLGIDATVAVGHSLGEISALHWAGSMDEAALLRVAQLRGQTMAEHSESGTMASILAGPDQVTPLLAEEPVVIAGYNSPDQTVVAGPVPAVERVCSRASEAGLGWMPLRVSHAFHSPLVAPAADVFAERLSGAEFGPVARRIHSTVTGSVLEPGTDVIALLRQQIVDPVRFAHAVAAAAAEVDLFVEVGPGHVLGRLATATADVPAVSLDTDSESLAPLLTTVGAAFVVGVPVAPRALVAGRPERSLEIGAELTFFSSPCETAPELDLGEVAVAGAAAAAAAPATANGGQPIETAATPGDSMQLLRELVAARAELPVESIGEDSRLLDDLHLSSVTVGQVLSQAARERGLTAAQTPTNFATATLRELATALEELGETSLDADSAGLPPAVGVASWVRPFRLDMVDAALPAGAATEPNGSWRVYGHADHPLVEPLRDALESGGVGSGVAACLPPDCQEADLETALAAAKDAAAQEPGGRFLLVQHGRGASGIAKTLRLEAPGIRTTIVDAPQVYETVSRALAEVRATTGFTEVLYDPDGQRRVPLLRLVSPRAGKPALDVDDVLLVTGGGKGITAECALALATESGARLGILGRSNPAEDPELQANLARMSEAGVTVRYARADVTDAGAVQSAVAELAGELGTVTAVLHGAGRNQPAALTGLDLVAFRETLAPKLDGLSAVLDAVEPDALRLLVTFGSIIGRAGLRGEAHYATANDWLADATEEVARKHPQCRVLCLEWSVWSGVGMGERLSVIESLIREGVTPIPPDDGINVLRDLLADPDTPPVVVVTGRAEGIDTVRYDRPELPLLRFVEQPVVHYHGVELVADAELTPGSDPYLADHLLDGNLLFPAVIGMEAMAQAAVGLTGWTGAPTIERAEFSRPIVVAPDGATKIRIAALRTGEDTVDVVIRSAETSFAADHFRATVRCPDGALGPDRAVGVDQPGAAGVVGLPEVPLDPLRELYGGILFQGGRFQRLRRYRRVVARQAVGEVAAGTSDWFSDFLPGRLLLADPGMRDALMHGIQVCVPDATLLPSGIERVVPAGPEVTGQDLSFSATERHNEGDTYVYDIEVRSAEGRIVERWEGLRLRAVRKQDGSGPWVAPLLGPFLQRRTGDLVGVDLSIVVEPDRGDTRRVASTRALSRAIGNPVTPRYRPDGRPEIDGHAVSAAHGAGLTVGLAGPGVVACDVEPVVARSTEQWTDLLGAHIPLVELTAADTGESTDVAATRVWGAVECLQKAGVSVTSPITLGDSDRPGWAIFTAGRLRVVTFATTVHGVDEPVVFSILTGGGH